MKLLDLIRFRLRTLAFALTVKPVVGAAGDDDKEEEEEEQKADEKDDKEADEKDEKADEKDDADDDDDDAAAVKEPPDAEEWKRLARRSQKAHKRLEEKYNKLAAKDQQRTEAEKTAHQKELDEARKEVEESLGRKHELERRQDRLESAATLMATRGVKVGKDDKQRTVKFNDPDDALVHLERAIAKGDVDGDELFDKEGKVDKTALSAALAELLGDKPHLGVESKPRKSQSAGDGDGGKGSGGTGTELEDMTPEDHFNQIFKGGKAGAAK